MIPLNYVTSTVSLKSLTIGGSEPVCNKVSPPLDGVWAGGFFCVWTTALFLHLLLVEFEMGERAPRLGVVKGNLHRNARNKGRGWRGITAVWEGAAVRACSVSDVGVVPTRCAQTEAEKRQRSP